MESYSIFYYVLILWAQIKFVRFTHTIKSNCSLFFLIAEKITIMWIHHNLFIYSTIDGCLCYFPLWAIRNSAACLVGSVADFDLPLGCGKKRWSRILTQQCQICPVKIRNPLLRFRVTYEEDITDLRSFSEPPTILKFVPVPHHPV